MLARLSGEQAIISAGGAEAVTAGVTASDGAQGRVIGASEGSTSCVDGETGTGTGTGNGSAPMIQFRGLPVPTVSSPLHPTGSSDLSLITGLYGVLRN